MLSYYYISLYSFHNANELIVPQTLILVIINIDEINSLIITLSSRNIIEIYLNVVKDIISCRTSGSG